METRILGTVKKGENIELVFGVTHPGEAEVVKLIVIKPGDTVVDPSWKNLKEGE